MRADRHHKASECDKICADCGLSHSLASRVQRLRRILPASTFTIRAAFPCSYPSTPAGERRLHRDLLKLRAVRANGDWTITP